MTWLAPPDGSPGHPAVFSDAAIQFCLTIKVLFKLSLRQTTGMVESLPQLANLNWTVPDYFTLCLRQKTPAVQIPYLRADGPLNLLVDNTASSFRAAVNGRPASTAFRDAASSARCIWPWTRPRLTSMPWNLPPAATATVRSCQSCLTRSPRAKIAAQ